MTAKTGKDEADEAEAVPAEAETEETGETGAAAKPARPAAKRKRRVRVIEVIDDEDLDEVLEALDAEDAEESEEAEEEPPARPAKAVKTEKAAARPAAKPRPSRLEPPEEDADEEAPKKAPARESAGSSGDRAAQPKILGLGMTQAVVVVVLVALLASLAIWQWRTASGLSSEKDERAAVSKVASAYGDMAFNYNAQNYQKQADKAQKLMGGDLLEEFKNTTLPTVANAFKTDPQVVLSSKTNQVFVGSVNGKFATAVVMVDVSLKTKDGAVDQPATLLRLSLGKIDGEWKVTQQYPSGVNDQNKGQQQGQLPGAPTGGASKSPAPDKSEKPGD